MCGWGWAEQFEFLKANILNQMKLNQIVTFNFSNSLTPKFWRYSGENSFLNFENFLKWFAFIDDEGNHYQHQALTEKYVKYFKSILHRNNYYFWKYCLCEAMNFGILFANFWITDYYLNGNFWYYGLNVLNFNRYTATKNSFLISSL